MIVATSHAGARHRRRRPRPGHPDRRPDHRRRRSCSASAAPAGGPAASRNCCSSPPSRRCSCVQAAGLLQLWASGYVEPVVAAAAAAAPPRPAAARPRAAGGLDRPRTCGPRSSAGSRVRRRGSSRRHRRRDRRPPASTPGCSFDDGTACCRSAQAARRATATATSSSSRRRSPRRPLFVVRHGAKEHRLPRPDRAAHQRPLLRHRAARWPELADHRDRLGSALRLGRARPSPRADPAGCGTGQPWSPSCATRSGRSSPARTRPGSCSPNGPRTNWPTHRDAVHVGPTRHHHRCPRRHRLTVVDVGRPASQRHPLRRARRPSCRAPRRQPDDRR